MQRNPIEQLSVVFTHWGMNDQRSELMKRSILSLVHTVPDAEIIVVDNGGSLEDSSFLLGLTDSGAIASYTRFRKNMNWPYARNDGLKRASRHYIAITDNDIIYQPGWAEDCIDFLDQNQGLYLATPLAPDPMNNVAKRWAGEVGGWRLNTRAGSNSWIMRRPDLEKIGLFEGINKGGSKYVDRYVRMGYLMGVMPVPKATDEGLRAGYSPAAALMAQSL